MKAIGFYSFKGGVGRTNLLLNVAYHLAVRHRQHVGLMDLDLEAPGLTVMEALRPAPGVEAVADVGLADLLDAATSALRGKRAGDVPEVTDLFYEVALANGKLGSIHLAPAECVFGGEAAGDAVRRSSEALSRLGETWQGDRRVGRDVFRVLRQRIEGHRGFVVTSPGEADRKVRLDYLLVDLRTGLTELADTAVGALINEVVLVGGLNEQNRRGLFDAVEVFRRAAEASETLVYVTPVISPVPNGELFAVREKLNALRTRFEAIQAELPPDSRLTLKLFVPDGVARLHTIHYTDYLAVHDGVLLQDFPEVLAAREIEAIAEALSPSSIAARQKETQSDLAELAAAPVAAPETDRRPRGTDAAWAWVARHWERPASWDWPWGWLGADPAGAAKFRADLAAEVDEPETIEPLLNGLATSLSLSVEERSRILESLGALRRAQVRELLRIFEEERAKFGALGPEHKEEIGRLVGTCAAEWCAVLRRSKVELPDGVAAVERLAIFKGEDMRPRWALLAGLAQVEADAGAVEAALRALLDEPDWPLRALVFALRGSAAHAAALRGALVPVLRNALTRHSERETSAWNSLGNALRDAWGLAVVAEAAYRKAIEFDAASSAPWNGLGNVLKTTGRAGEAEEAYHKAIELDSASSHPWNGLGNMLNAKGRAEEAEAAYRKAIELDPRFAAPWNGLGNLLKSQFGRYAEAEEAYRKAIELDPSDKHPCFNLATLLHWQLGRPDEAEAAYRKAIEIAPTWPRPWGGLGDLLLSERLDVVEAEAAYRRALALDETLASAWVDLAYLQGGALAEYAEAERSCRAALALEERYASAWTGLGRLLQDHLARDAEASAAFDTAADCGDDVDRARAEFGRLRLVLRTAGEVGLPPAYDRARAWLDGLERPLRPNQASCQLAALAALCDRPEIAHEALALIACRHEYALNAAGRQFVQRALGLAPDPLAPYAPGDRWAGDLEDDIHFAALLATRMSPAGRAETCAWVRDALTRFVPPPGGRVVHRLAVDAYLTSLGVELPADADPSTDSGAAGDGRR